MTTESQSVTQRVFNPTPQQIDFVNFIQSKKGNGILDAVAGSGKSSTVRYAMTFIEGAIAYCAYNSDAAKDNLAKMPQELKDRVWVPQSRTFHSYGNSSWMTYAKSAKLEDTKDWKKKKINIIMAELKVPFHHQQFVRLASTRAKQRCFAPNSMRPAEIGFINMNTDREAWMDMIEHFDMKALYADFMGRLPSNIDQMIREAVQYTTKAIGRSIDMADRLIEFEDMLYMPLVSRCPIQEFDYVLVDEAQDLNMLRKAYAKRMVRPDGFIYFIGDPYQAIYGFTGAEAKMFETIKQEFNCTTLPLSVSFRNSLAVIRRAQSWVKHIEAAPGAIEGSNPRIKSSQFWSEYEFHQEDDAILCRNVAPLVDLSLQLFSKGIPNHIEGRDISDTIIKLIERNAKGISLCTALVPRLEAYKERRVLELEELERDAEADELEDNIDAVMSIIKRVQNRDGLKASVQSVVDEIRSMFGNNNDPTEKKKPTLTLSTCHKSKGREWKRVFWWGNNIYQPSARAKKEWEFDQERNLMYVAATRAMIDLVEVVLDPLERKNAKKKRGNK